MKYNLHLFVKQNIPKVIDMQGRNESYLFVISCANSHGNTCFKLRYMIFIKYFVTIYVDYIYILYHKLKKKSQKKNNTVVRRIITCLLSDELLNQFKSTSSCFDICVIIREKMHMKCCC